MSANQRSTIIINLIGKDRPGLVDELAREVSGSGGNWESSRMARLSDQFAGIVQVVIAESDVPDLERRIAALEQGDLHVSLTPAHSAQQSEKHAADQSKCQLELVGQDRPGIVSSVSSALAAAEVNVIEFETDCTQAPMSGEQLFRARATILLPADLDPYDLQQSLEAIANDLMVEIDLSCSISS